MILILKTLTHTCTATYWCLLARIANNAKIAWLKGAFCKIVFENIELRLG